MRNPYRMLIVLALAGVSWLVDVEPTNAYIGAPPASLGMMCWWSTHAIVVRVEQVDKQKRVIVYRKVQEFKGKWPSAVIRHVIGPHPYIMEWAEPGKTAVIFALENYKWSHTYID